MLLKQSNLNGGVLSIFRGSNPLLRSIGLHIIWTGELQRDFLEIYFTQILMQSDGQHVTLYGIAQQKIWILFLHKLESVSS